MKKKTIKHSSIIIGLLGLLAVPFMSSGDVTVKCETEESEAFVNTCLPSARGNFLPRSSGARSAVIFGVGKNFSEAWEDATEVCVNMVSTVSSGRIYESDIIESNEDCPITSCEVVAPRSMPLNGTCLCIRKLVSRKQTGHPQCVELERYDMNMSSRSYYSFSDMYADGLSDCADDMKTSPDVGQVYCF